jgi:vitamin B12 transporter
MPRARPLDLLAAGAAAALLSPPAGAQEPVPSGGTPRDSAWLRPVVVTATRIAQPSTVPSVSATVISGATLRARGITHVADALRDVPGAAVLQNGSFGAQTSLFLRGGDSKYTQVLVDGVPVNQAGGAFNWANLTTDNVDRVEIVRGPASVLYGSDAVTGVVQIFTRRGAGRPRASLAARAGSYGTTEGELTASGGAGALGWSAGAARYASSGVLDTLDYDNRYRNESLNGAVRWARDGAGDVTVAARGQRARFNFPTDGAGRLADLNSFREEARASVSIDAGRQLLPSLEARALLGAAGLRGRNDDRPDGPADTLGFSQGFVSRDGTTRRNADLRLNYRPATGTVVTVGGEYRGTAFRSADTSFARGAATPGTRFAPHRDNRAAYGQVLADVADRLSINLGGRYDDNSAFGAFRTVRGGIGVRLADGLRVRAAAGNAFREPTLPENFARTRFERGNASLRPERSRSVEAGVEHRLLAGRVTLGGTWFLQRFRDVIQYGRLAPSAGGDSSHYFNVAAANAGGVEAEARVATARGAVVAASYTHVDTRVTDAGFQSGANQTFVAGSRLLRRPANLASLALTAPVSDRGTVTARVNHTGRRDDMNFATFTRGTLPSFTTVAVAADVAVLRRAAGRGDVALTARAENALDRRYESFYGFRAPGRTIIVGARVGTP